MLFREDKLAFACLIPLFTRIAFVHVVLLYGTNNVQVSGLSEVSIRNRMVGARLVLASRIAYAATLWMLKFTITEFLKRFTIQIWRHSYEVALRCIRWFLLITFLAIVLADLAECHPVTHYWQVVPDPGAYCRQAYGQLLTMAICNVLTDLLLVIFPIPIILRSEMPLKRKLNILSLFGLSLIPIAVTVYRIPHIVNMHGRQQTRTLWASIEILAATGVANALVLGSFVRDRGVKKRKWRADSALSSMERSIPIRGTVARAWGSDEDLVRDLGLGVGYELRHCRHVSRTPRPAPKAIPASEAFPFPTPRSAEEGHSYRDAAAVKEAYTADTSSDEYNESIKIQRVRTCGSGKESDDDLRPIISPLRISCFNISGFLDSSAASNTRNITAAAAASSSPIGSTQDYCCNMSTISSNSASTPASSNSENPFSSPPILSPPAPPASSLHLKHPSLITEEFGPGTCPPEISPSQATTHTHHLSPPPPAARPPLRTFHSTTSIKTPKRLPLGSRKHHHPSHSYSFSPSHQQQNNINSSGSRPPSSSSVTPSSHTRQPPRRGGGSRRNSSAVASASFPSSCVLMDVGGLLAK